MIFLKLDNLLAGVSASHVNNILENKLLLLNSRSKKWICAKMNKKRVIFIIWDAKAEEK